MMDGIGNRNVMHGRGYRNAMAVGSANTFFGHGSNFLL